MKKFAILSIIGLFLSAFAVSQVQAGGYHSRVLGVCSHCKKNIYAYYKPVYYNGCHQYMWVPAYHTACLQARYSRSYYPSGHGFGNHGGYYNSYVPSYRNSYSPSYYYPRSGLSIGIHRPGFSISICR